ncbi:MAG: NAD(+)/NADH kinase [Desulfobacterales bacterium]|nr:NAD(+)/NADH kinase [Desulfobacterales bacterium]
MSAARRGSSDERPRRVGVYVKKDPRAAATADEFEAWLHARGVEVLRRQSPSPSPRGFERRQGAPPRGLFCVFVLGGDGTFLSAVRWIGDRDVPVLGVKLGEVGFLAEIAAEELFQAADKVLAGEFTLTQRMRLDVRVNRGRKLLARETVLNDIVINKGALARLANIDTLIDGHFLTTFRADGLIVSTPTGSTAYSLAAGGPVVHPHVPGIIITPICPFTLTIRPLVVPDGVEIAIRLQKGSSDILLTFDGQKGLDLTDRDVITVRQSAHPVNLINVPGRPYFDVLKSKLRWSGGRV